MCEIDLTGRLCPVRPLACCFLGVVALFSLIGLSACGGSQPMVDLQPGALAPDFVLDAVRGGTYHLEDLRGQVVLLSFLNTQAEATSATPDHSRSQIVFLKSVQEQYGPKGALVLIVDAARLETGRQPSEDDLINFTYDWNLDTIPVLIEDAETTRAYGVFDTPTTFLIDAEGLVQQRWDGFASVSQLAFALEELVGPPAFREMVATGTAPAPETATVCAGETPARARFAGVGLARPLSEDLWVVDGGQAWESGGAWPLQWIVLARENAAGEGQLHLQVIARYPDSSESLVLVDQRIELLPEDEARGLLVGEVDDVPGVYLLTTSVMLERPGCLQIEAVVTRIEDAIPLYTGQALVTVR